MKITKRLQEKAAKAKEAGYDNVYVTLGAFKATTYVHFWGIDRILRATLGDELIVPYPRTPWRGTQSTRNVDGKDIQYSALFRRF